MPGQEQQQSLGNKLISGYINEHSNKHAFKEELFHQLVDTLSKQDQKGREMMTEYIVNFLQQSHSQISYG